MGIETALIAGAGAGLLGSYLGGQAQKESAETAAQAAQQSATTQQQMFQQGLETTAPYRQIGEEALGGLRQFMTPQGQQQMLEGYTGSDLYQQQLSEAERARLRSASATGALRTSETGQALGALPSQLQQNYLGQQFGRLSGIAGLGASAAGQAAGGFQTAGQTIGQTQQQAGAYQGQAQAAPGMALAGGLSDLGGLGLFYAMQGQSPTMAPGSGSGFSYNYGAQI